MNRKLLTQRAVSLMLSAAMIIPAGSIPAQIFAQDDSEQSFGETSDQPFTEEEEAVEPASDEETSQMSEAEESENSEAEESASSEMSESQNEQPAEAEAPAAADEAQPQADAASDSINIDLSSVLSADLDVPTAPWDDATAAADTGDQSGTVKAKLDLAELLKNVPDIFEAKVGWWKNARLWPLQSKLNGQVVNGMPINITVTAPEDVTFTGNYTIDDQTGGHDYSWSDKPGSNLLSSAKVTFTGSNTANVSLTLGYVQYKELLAAIQDGSIGSWAVDLPVKYSVAEGTDLSSEKFAVTGTAGSPYHKSAIGGLSMDVNVQDAEIPAFTAEPLQLAGVVDDQIPVTSGLKINGGDSAALDPQTSFTLTGSLAVSNIKDKLMDKIGGYNVSEILDQVKVHDTSLLMTATVQLPDQATWNGDINTLSLKNGDAENFKITDATLNGKTLTINFALQNLDDIKDLSHLVDIMNKTSETMELDIAGLTTTEGPTGTPAKISCNVTGVFSSYAVIPDASQDSGKTPGLYQIKYTMVDQAAPTVDLTVNGPAGIVDDVVNISSDLKINGTQSSASFKEGDTFSLNGKLDISQIRAKLQDKIDKYEVADVLDKVAVKDTDLTMTAVVNLPEQVTWNGTAADVAFTKAEHGKNFAITGVKQEGQKIVISMALPEQSSITTLADLVKIMNETDDVMDLEIKGVKAATATGEKPAQITCNVTGVFVSSAFIPDGTPNPGYYQIKYTFNDTATPAAQVTITKPEQTKPEPEPEVKNLSVYRVYNPNSGEHFYTENKEEKDHLIKVGWNDEGIGWQAPDTSKFPVYRLYNANAGDHHFTKNEAEKDMLVKIGWKYEGIGFYSMPDNEGTPIYRAYNPNAKMAGAHNYTKNVEENLHIISLGWLGEGIGWWGADEADSAEK